MSEKDKTISKLLDELHQLRNKIDKQDDLELKLSAKDREIRNQEERYRSLYEDSSICKLSILLATEKVLRVNESGVETFGYPSRHDLISNFSLDFHCGEAKFKKKIISTIKGSGFISGIITRMIRKNTTYFWAELNAVLSEGDAVMECFIIDITERKRMEEVRAYSGQTLRSVKRTVPDIIYKLDTQGRITFIGDPVKNYGFSPEELIGKNILDLVHPDDRPKASYRINERRTGLRSTKSLEVRLLHKDDLGLPITRLRKKRNKPISLIAAEGLYVSENTITRNFIGTQGIVIDITERKKTEEALRKAKDAAESANRLKSEFLANMSHNIRTPLNGILGFANLLLNSEIKGKYRDYLTKIINSGDELLNLINDILDYSKLETGKLDIYEETFLIGDLIKGLEAASQLHYRPKDVTFTIEVSSNVPEIIYNDKWRIHQVLANLISNSFKFTEKGQIKLTIQFNPKKDWIVFNLKDSGVGISKKNLNQIFMPFFQISTNKAGTKKGPGLGLALCKNLVELMGGEIRLKSKIRIGTEFIVSLPIHSNKIRVESITRKIAEEDVSDLEAKNRNTILIAEDNPVNQMLIQEQLKKKGFTSLLLAKNGKEAVVQALKNQPDLILMDIQMPKMDGNQAIQQLREKQFNGPIIAVSAYGIREEINRSLEIGATDYITKPIDFNHFFPKISKFLKIKKEPKEEGVKKKAADIKPERESYTIKGVVSDTVFEVFLSDAKEKIRIMDESLKNFSKEKEKIKAIAHEYKGNAQYFGLQILETKAREVDQAFKDKKKETELKKLSSNLLTLVKDIVADNS